MFLPYTVDVPMERLPLANWGLIAVTSMISMAMLIRGPAPAELDWANDPDFTSLSRELAPPWSLVPGRFSFLQLFSHQLVHGSFLHLVGNMIFLFVFGNAVNAKLGQVSFLASYFLLGALAGVAWLIFGNGLPALGASGAIMGIVGVFLVLFPRNDVSILYFWTGGGGSFEISSVWLILFYMVLDLIGTLRAGEGIAYVSHLTGELCGIALAGALVLAGYVQSTRYEENLLEVMGMIDKKKAK